ncbi:MAG: hypothetical protein ABFD50_02390 [Smithella sp.]
MEKLSLKKLFQGKFVKLGIKIICSTSGFTKEFHKINIQIINRIPFSISKNNNIPTISIITKRFSNRLAAMPEPLCRQVIETKIISKNLVFLIFANSSSIPAFFKNTINTGTSISASIYDEHYLRSLLKALILEKFQGTISIHGVVLEMGGKGILITGASGIGKTTAALNIISKNDYWVADDFIIVKRNKNGKLIASGHKKIKDYIHTEATGIVHAEKILGSNGIKKNTKLYAIVEVERNNVKDAEIIRREKKILDIKLICFHINIPLTGYFNEILLRKALEQLPKENQ